MIFNKNFTCSIFELDFVENEIFLVDFINSRLPLFLI